MKERDYSLDVFKGLLVFGMIYDHVLGFFGNISKSSIEWYITWFVKIITFSGFMFSFGYAYQIAYFCKDAKKIYKKIIISGIKPLIAFYISAMFYRIFISNNLSDFEDILKILLLGDIPPVSEFLASFFVVALTALIFFNNFKQILRNKKIFVAALIVPLFFTFIPYEKVTVSQIGLLIGSANFNSFPVLQYMPFFLIGMFFSKYDIKFNFKIFIGSIASTLIFIFYFLITDEFPNRFPPSIYWILSPMFFLYLYYIFSKTLLTKNIPTGFIQLMGKNVLFYLVISNISLFIYKAKYSYVYLNAVESLAVTILIVSIIGFLIFISRK